jgi:hypothetical protein
MNYQYFCSFERLSQIILSHSFLKYRGGYIPRNTSLNCPATVTDSKRDITEVASLAVILHRRNSNFRLHGCAFNMPRRQTTSHAAVAIISDNESLVYFFFTQEALVERYCKRFLMTGLII